MYKRRFLDIDILGQTCQLMTSRWRRSVLDIKAILKIMNEQSFPNITRMDVTTFDYLLTIRRVLEKWTWQFCRRSYFSSNGRSTVERESNRVEWQSNRVASKSNRRPSCNHGIKATKSNGREVSARSTVLARPLSGTCAPLSAPLV